MALASRVAAAGVRLVVHDRLGSTNAEALALARAGERGPLWVLAREQTEGRGRRGRSWISPPGNLYATLLLSEPSAPALAPQLSFVAALALHDALTELAPGARGRLALKWPNDVLVGGAKVAGILIEGEAASAGFAVVIGIGLNCASHPAGTSYPATDLAAAGIAASADAVLDRLSAALAQRLAQWDRGDGFARIRADWTARAARIGEAIVLRATEEVGGTFQGIDESGRLLLRAADGSVRAFAAAEVQAGAPAAALPAQGVAP
ncbi:MAG: biotin--[acetyl-CoA-carboxylase] ligase [Variibacter sp.]|nr:biotin--[acetyl-CoA-carboxylase] ligase [Variibacter sp.]